VSYLLGFGVLGGLALLDHWLFLTFLDTTHLEWYLANGALIGIVTSVVASAWGSLDRNPDLISAHPLRYLAACCTLVALPTFALGTHLRRSDDPAEARPALEILATVVFSLMLVGLLVVWAVVVVPLQYGVYLLCGAPARLHRISSWRPIARREPNGGLALREAHRDEPVPEPWWDASVFACPVASTALCSSLLFLVLGAFLP
jgi:hypothetical protein